MPAQLRYATFEPWPVPNNYGAIGNTAKVLKENELARVRLDRVIKGFVVRRQTIVKDETSGATRTVRTDVSRTFHARSAAESFLDLCKKQWPDGDFYIHEKMGADGLAQYT